MRFRGDVIGRLHKHRAKRGENKSSDAPMSRKGKNLFRRIGELRTDGDDFFSTESCPVISREGGD